MKRSICLVLFVGAISFADEKQTSRAVGNEYYREYERKVESKTVLTEEEIARRKKDADRAKEILGARVHEMYTVNYNGANSLRQWHDMVHRYEGHAFDYMTANLLNTANNRNRAIALKERRSPVYENIYQNRLWDNASSNYPHLTQELELLAKEWRDLMVDLAMQKWEFDKFLFH